MTSKQGSTASWRIGSARSRTRIAIVLAVAVAYGLAFLPLYRAIGDMAPALSMAPVALTAWFYGMRAGVVAGLLAVPLNVLLLTLAAPAGWDPIKLVVGSPLILAVGGVIGRIRDLGEHWRQALLEHAASKQALEQRNRELAILTGITQSLAYSVRLADVLKTALDKTLELFDIERGGIYLISDDGKYLELTAYTGLSEEAATALRILPADKGINGRVVSTGTSLVVDDVLNQADVAFRPVLESQGIRSAIFIPLKSKSKTVGVFNASSSGSRRFTPEELSLLEVFAGQIGIAIENARLFERTSQLALSDDLTGLNNRRQFNQVVESEMDRARRDGRAFSIVMLDLDWFKQHNDRFGHLSGDAVLKALAGTMKSALRRTDSAFRIGGDEFSFVLPGTRMDGAQKIVDRVRREWQRTALPEYPGADNPISFSAGIAEFPAGADSADGLITLADSALYESRRSKRQAVSSLDGSLTPDRPVGD